VTASTIPHLRPLSLGKLLDQAIRLYRRNFFTFIGIIAIVQIPLTVIQLVVSLLTFGDFFSQLEQASGGGPLTDPTEIFTPAYFSGIGVSLLLGIAGLFLIKGVATAALTRAIADNYLGESVGITESYRKIREAWLPLIIALIVAVVVSVGLFIWTLVPCVGWLTGGGILVFFWMVVVPLIAPIIVLEKQTATQSIRRAWDLARRRFWWVLGFVFILFIFAQLVITGPATLINLIFQFVLGSPLEFSASRAITQTVIQSLVQLVFSLVYLPLQLTAITLLYFDLRVRTEGFDLALLSATASTGPAEEVSDLTTQAPRPEQGNWITLPEMGYFALIELGALVLYVVFVVIIGGLVFALMAASGNIP
jgi:hypothetical protein